MALIFREGHILLLSLLSIIKEKESRILLVTYCSSSLFMKTSHLMTGEISIGGKDTSVYLLGNILLIDPFKKNCVWKMCASNQRMHSEDPNSKRLGYYFKWLLYALSFKPKNCWRFPMQICLSFKDSFTLLMLKMAELNLQRTSEFCHSLSYLNQI